MQRLHQRPPPLDTSITTGSPIVHYGSPFGFSFTAPPMIFNGTSVMSSPVGTPTVIPSPVQAIGSPFGYYSDGFSSQTSPSIIVPTARSAFAQSIPAIRTDSTASVAPAFSGQPLSPTVLRHPKLQAHPQSSSDSLRRTVLMRQQQNSASALNPNSTPSSPSFPIGSPSSSSFASSPTSQSSVSSNDPPPMASCTTITMPSKTPLPPSGDTSVRLHLRQKDS